MITGQASTTRKPAQSILKVKRGSRTFRPNRKFWINETCAPTAWLHQLGTCNPKVDAEANTALATQETDPSTAQLDWQRAYTLIDSDARLIPIDTPPTVDLLLSPRVGDAELTPSSALEALLDQFWVH